MRTALVLLCGVLLCYFHGTSSAETKRKGKTTKTSTHLNTKEEIPEKRTFGKTKTSTHPDAKEEIPEKRTFEIKKQRGVILERWDGIDGYLCKKLLEDPRFPSMPTYLSYASTFSEPVNWGDNYGSRIRGYFVPEQSGPHIFFIESDNQGQLYLSTTDNPDQKILICQVGKDHESLPLQFRKYPEQESYPINLQKDTYYYIEALHKEQYGNDSLAVAVQTPDQKFYAPIPSQFLWTKAPQANKTASNSPYLLLKIAAKAGAKAGATLGISEAKQSGAQAGAMAGAEAGQKAGAEAGAVAAAKAATEVATKTLKEALQRLGTLNKPIFNIFTANGSVIPVQPGATSLTGEQPGVSGVNATGTTTSGAEGLPTGQLGQTSQTGQISHALTGQTGHAVTGQTGMQTTINASVGWQVRRPGAQAGAASHPGIFHGAFVYNRAIPYYIPPKAYNPHIAARHQEFLDPQGFARVIVNGAMYVLYSIDVPANQNPMYNLCWRITHGKLELTQNCQAFVAHIPGFDNRTGEHQTISFESLCAPGYYIRQKNYRFVLGKRGDTKFDYDASTAFFQVFSLPGAFQFSLMRKGWYICRSENKDYHRTAIVTDFNMADEKWLKRCSFALRPLSASENAQMNCFDTVEPSKPPGFHGISSPQPTSSTAPQRNKTTPTTQPTIVPTTPGPCLNFHFYNDAGVPFMLYSNLKPEGYLVTGPEIHLHYVIRNGNTVGLTELPQKREKIPDSVGEMLSEVMDKLSDNQQLHMDPPKMSEIAAKNIVKFWAKDPYGKREILLDGKKIVYAIPGIHCDHRVQVTVTSRPKPSPSTTPTQTTTLKPTTPSTIPTVTILPPAPPPIPITFPPPPPPPRHPHVHIHIHQPPPPLRQAPKPTHAPPPPLTTTEPSPPALAPTKPPPPPKTTPPTTKFTTTLPPCGPEVPEGSKTTVRPCLPTTPTFPQTKITTPPPCSPTSGPLPPGSPPCKPTTAPPVLPPCSSGSPPPCSPGPIPPPSPPPIPPPCSPGTPLPCAPGPAPPPSPPPVSSPPCSPAGGPQTPGAPPPCPPPPSTVPPPVVSVILPTLPPAPTVPSVTVSLAIQGCMPTHGGTSHGACCMFPFTYHGVPQHRCTRAERGYRWCSTTANYDADRQWGFCASCFLCYGGNSNGNCCHFPFMYGGKMYTTCTTQDGTKPWCATTYNYDVDKQWGYCGGDAPGSVPQPKIAFPPCSSDCDGKCIDTCPDYCCVKGKTSTQTQPAAVPPPSQVQQVIEVQQPSRPCPAICSKYCAPDCPVRCCNLSPPAPYVPSPPPAPVYCPQICYSTCVSSCPADCCSNTQQGVNRNTLSYTVSLPCPTNCFSSCSANCPPQCCKATNKRNRMLPYSATKRIGESNVQLMTGEIGVPFTGGQSPLSSTIMVRSKLLCPDICSKVCSWHCPNECCSKMKKESSGKENWNPASLDCKNGVLTIGGNAQGACCKFPFIYKGAVYWECTAQDAVKKWCSVTKVFEIDKKWGFCS